MLKTCTTRHKKMQIDHTTTAVKNGYIIPSKAELPAIVHSAMNEPIVVTRSPEFPIYNLSAPVLGQSLPDDYLKGCIGKIDVINGTVELPDCAPRKKPRTYKKRTAPKKNQDNNALEVLADAAEELGKESLSASSRASDATIDIHDQLDIDNAHNELLELSCCTGFSDSKLKVRHIGFFTEMPLYRFSYLPTGEEKERSIELKLDEHFLVSLAAWICQEKGIVKRYVKFCPIAAIEAFIRASEDDCSADYKVSLKHVHNKYKAIYKENSTTDECLDSGSKKFIKYAQFVKRVNDKPFMEVTAILATYLQKCFSLEQARLIRVKGHGDQMLQIHAAFLSGTGIQDIVSADGLNLAVNPSIQAKIDISGTGRKQKKHAADGNKLANSTSHNYGMKSVISMAFGSGAILGSSTGKGTSIEFRQVDPQSLMGPYVNTLSIFDRGYYATHFMAKLLDYKQLFIVRVRDSCKYMVNRITDIDGNEIPVPPKTINPENKKLSAGLKKGNKMPKPGASDPAITKLLEQHGYLNLYLDAETYIPVEDITEDFDIYFDKPIKDGKQRRCRIQNLRLCAKYDKYRSHNSSRDGTTEDMNESYLYVVTNAKESMFACDVVCMLYSLRWKVEHGVKCLRQGSKVCKAHSRSAYTNQTLLNFAFIRYAMKSFVFTRAETSLPDKKLDEVTVAHISEHAKAADLGIVRAREIVTRGIKHVRNKRLERPHYKTCEPTAFIEDIKFTKGSTVKERVSNLLNDTQIQALRDSSDEVFKLLDLSAKEIDRIALDCFMFGTLSPELSKIMALDQAFRKIGRNTQFTQNILETHKEAIKHGIDPALAFAAPGYAVGLSMMSVHRDPLINRSLANSFNYIKLGIPCCSKKHDINALPQSNKPLFARTEEIIIENCKQSRLNIASFERRSDYRVVESMLFARRFKDRMPALINEAIYRVTQRVTQARLTVDVLVNLLS